MNSLFKYAIEFNEDISYWNTSNVINMNNMFNNASNFNINISKWNVKNVENMSFYVL